MTTDQKKLAALTGTPKHFGEAIWNAYLGGMISLEKAKERYEKYKQEWSEAGQVSRDLETEIIDEPPF